MNNIFSRGWFESVTGILHSWVKSPNGLERLVSALLSRILSGNIMTIYLLTMVEKTRVLSIRRISKSLLWNWDWIQMLSMNAWIPENMYRLYNQKPAQGSRSA